MEGDPLLSEEDEAVQEAEAASNKSNAGLKQRLQSTGNKVASFIAAERLSNSNAAVDRRAQEEEQAAVMLLNQPDAPVPDLRPSLSNSEIASRRLEELGLGVDTIAAVIKEALTAQMVVYDKYKGRVRKVPDHRVRLDAVRLLKEIHGLTYVPQQKQEAVPVQFLQIINDVQQKPYAELLKEAEKMGFKEIDAEEGKDV